MSEEEFRAWVAPHAVEIRRFATAVHEVRARHGNLPDAESAAMAERADEPAYAAHSYWEHPFTDTQMFGGLTPLAAADCVRGFVELFRSATPPCTRICRLYRLG